MKKSVTARKKKIAVSKAPAIKKVVKRGAVETTNGDDKTPSQLIRFSLEDLINWRNSARKRCDSRENDLKILKNKGIEIIREVRRLDKKQHSDLVWIGKLNRVISKKVF